MSSFTAIQTALSGLMAHQKSLEVTGHNITNAQTPGFHRQEAVLQARVAEGTGTGVSTLSGLGVGVDVVSVRRMQGTYVQQQLRGAEGEMGRWGAAQDTLQQVESILSPGSNLTIASLADKFFTAWTQLGNTANSEANRLAVRSAGVNLTNALNGTANSLQTLAQQTEEQVREQVTQLNQLSDALAAVNAQIGSVGASGAATADLQDQRDQVLSQLAQLSGAATYATGDTDAIINVGGRSLVQGSTAHHLAVERGPEGLTITWEDGSAANVQSGSIAGLLEMHNTAIPAYQQQLDDVAMALAQSVNQLHSTGVTMDGNSAGDFFTGQTAATISVSNAVQASARQVAATRTPDATADGSLAKEIAAVANRPLLGNSTIPGIAQTLLGHIGNAVRTAEFQVDANTALRDQLISQEETVSGVNMDEELTNMMVFQRGYDASARVLTTADEMMRSLLEMLG